MSKPLIILVLLLVAAIGAAAFLSKDIPAPTTDMDEVVPHAAQ